MSLDCHILTLSSLRATKNAAIENPLANLQLARDHVFISQLIQILNDPPTPTATGSQYALRIEAAHIISSLSYGSEEALAVLLRGNTHQALISALSRFSSANSPTLPAAVSRALRAFTASLADLVGPPLWGLSAEPLTIRSEAKNALDYLFQDETLDVYLPLLIPSMTCTNSATPMAVLTSIAQMLGSIIRTPAHRRAVTEWLPCQEIRSRRGREKLSLNGTSTSPWILRQLGTLLGDQERECKLIEAILYALAALVKENTLVADHLEKSTQDEPPLLAIVLNYTKSISLDVQLAACLCITHALRSSSSFEQAHSSLHSTLGPNLQNTCLRTVMNIVNHGIATPPAIFVATSASSSESPRTKIKACFILHYLVSDNESLCQAAFERGCLEHLESLIKCVASEPAPPWEPESLAQLREAAFTCLASLALCSSVIRKRISDEHSILPHLSRALRTKWHIGTHYAACQCVRAISRDVFALRTGLVDSGLGVDVLSIVLGRALGAGGSANGDAVFEGRTDKRKDSSVVGDEFRVEVSDSGTSMMRECNIGEDARVLGAALNAVCNIVNDFSPFRKICLEEQLMPRLVYFINKSGDPALCSSAIFAVKNLIRKTNTETKRYLMSHLGWHDLPLYLSDPEPDIQEQGFFILRNLAENKEGSALVFCKVPQVLDIVAEGMRSSNEDVVLHSTYALCNLANGIHEQQDMIVKHPHLLPALQLCLTRSSFVRRPAVSCILVLVKSNPERGKEMAEAGIVGSLRCLCEWSDHPPSQPHNGHHGDRHSSLISGLGGVAANPSHASAVSGVDVPSRARSAVQSFVGGLNDAGILAGTHENWAGTGSLYHYLSSPAFTRQDQDTSVTDELDDEHDVIQMAREALGWLEHAETFATGTS